MFRKYIIPLLAVAGVVTAIQTVRSSGQTRPPAPPVSEPARSPFSYSIAGSGIIESSSENIAISTNIAGVVTEVMVKPGQRVKAGDPLFKVDDRSLKAELGARKAALAAAEAQLARLRQSPRPEDVPPAQARVTAAEAAVSTAESQLADARNQFALLEAVSDKRAVVVEDLTKRRDAVTTAQARLSEARASLLEAQSQLALLKAGTWSADLAVSEAEVEQARAAVAAVETDLERLTVRAPIDGEVLQRNVRVGEFATAGVLTDPLILLGETSVLHVRCDIDENDAWRLEPGSKARVSLRGNGEIFTDVQFVRVEPFVIPKRSLTGESTERVDTRVLQVLFSFPREAMRAYVGQLVDVRIEAGPVRPSPDRVSAR